MASEPKLETIVKTHNLVYYTLLMLGCVAAFSVQAQPTVANFSIVAPRIVENEAAFVIVVLEIDSQERPIAPGAPGTVELKAFLADSNGDSVSISPASFQASGEGSYEVTIILGAVPSGTRVFILVQGYGLPQCGGHFSGDMVVVDNANFGPKTNGIEISAPIRPIPTSLFPSSLPQYNALNSPTVLLLAMVQGFSFHGA